MLFVMNQTMKILEHTWTPVTMTDVRTMPVQKQHSYAIFTFKSYIHTGEYCTILVGKQFVSLA